MLGPDNLNIPGLQSFETPTQNQLPQQKSISARRIVIFFADCAARIGSIELYNETRSLEYGHEFSLMFYC